METAENSSRNYSESAPQKIIFATGNENKLREIRMILSDLPVEVLSMAQAGISAKPEETGQTFEENAMIKALAVRETAPADSIVMADDSGLEVDYLNGEPGVYSSRYLGEDTSYEIKNASIIDRLKTATEEERTARFICVIAAILPGGDSLVTKGIFEGRIAHEPAGCEGFGYDPIFYVPELGMTSTQLSPEQKNQISHRGRALRAMRQQLAAYLNTEDD